MSDTIGDLDAMRDLTVNELEAVSAGLVIPVAQQRTTSNGTPYTYVSYIVVSI